MHVTGTRANDERSSQLRDDEAIELATAVHAALNQPSRGRSLKL